MTVDVVTGEIVPAFTGGALTPEQTRARAQWVREVTKAALTEDVDYGTIPGTEKPTLFKPGAEMLLLAAGLGFTMTKVDDADAREHRGVTYTCSVMRGAFTVSQCDGYAGYDEARFYVSAEDAEARERANATKYKRPANPARFVEYRAPWNTLVKMAQKRALVGATLNATAGSGLFIADMDDAPAAEQPEPPPAPEPRTTTRPRTTRRRPDRPAAAGETRAAGADSEPKVEPVEGTDELEARLRALSDDQRQAFKDWRRSKTLDWPPASVDQLRLMAAEVGVIEARAAEDADAYGG